MALEIVKTFVIKATPAAVWEFLVDPQRVAKCMPGASIGDKLDDKTYSGAMTVKVGPVQSSYKGKIIFEKLDSAARTAEIVASGQDIKGKGGADLRLTSTLKEIAPGETEVTAVSKINITGILAQMGRGMIQDVSDQMFQVFSQRMRAELESAPTQAQPTQAQPTQAQPTQAQPTQAPALPQPPAAAPGSAATSLNAAPALAPQPVAPAPTPVANPPPAAPEALDLGAIGARAAGRALLRPGFIIVLGLIVFALYLLLRR